MPFAAGLAGTTGLVGSNIYTTLLTHPSISSLSYYARHDLPSTSTTPTPTKPTTPIISTDTSSWPTSFPTSTPLFLSSLGTTRAKAGGLPNQRKIDHDIPVALARAALQSGSTKVFVLISSSGANKDSPLGYPAMKGETEHVISNMGFEHTVILRPGLIVGERRAEDKRVAEWVVRQIAKGAGAVNERWLKDFWAQDAEVIARAAVQAGVMAVEGKVKEKVWVVGQADIVRLGRTEWGTTGEAKI